MTLSEIKESFFKSECGRYMREGSCLSEPVPMMIDQNLIDVFFIYKYNRTSNQYSRPLAKFGILAEKAECMFSESLIDDDMIVSLQNMVEGTVNRKERLTYYQDYERQYNKARALFYCDCSEEEKDILTEYWKSFKRFVEPNLLCSYRDIVPEFYSWLQTQIEM